MPTFHSASPVLNCAPAALRAFLGRPANIPQISNPDLELEILSAPAEVAVGQKIEFRITAYGFKQRVTHEYLAVAEDLIDEKQIDGPLRAWHSTQRIETVSDESCRLIDQIEFECPGGMLGYLLTESRIRQSIEDGMTFRYSTLQELIASGVIA